MHTISNETVVHVFTRYLCSDTVSRVADKLFRIHSEFTGKARNTPSANQSSTTCSIDLSLEHLSSVLKSHTKSQPREHQQVLIYQSLQSQLNRLTQSPIKVMRTALSPQTLEITDLTTDYICLPAQPNHPANAY